MATGRVPTTANSPLTAKGDLFGYSTTQARVPVGNDGETLVADSSTSTGLRYNPHIEGGKNFVINGNFDIWQRGTTITNPSNLYTADRWMSNSGETQTYTRQTSGAPTGSRYYARLTATQNSCFFVPQQLMETDVVSQLWGRTVVVSCLIRRNSTMNSDVTFSLDKSSTADAGIGASWSAINSVVITNAQMPTATTSSDWYRASFTASVPNDGTANSLRVRFLSNGVPNNSTMDLTQVQVEVGSTVTAFSRAGGTLAGELAACQRYFEKSYNLQDAPATVTQYSASYSSSNAAAKTTGYITAGIEFKTSKRTDPTITFYDLSGNSGKCRRFTPGTAGGEDNSAIGTYQPGSSGFLAESSGTSNRECIVFQWTASAEL